MALKIDAQLRGFDLCQVPAQARRLEELGFDAAWTFEAAQDPFLPLAVAATATEKLELGTNIAVAFARSPFSMAGTAWDIQRASRGRLHLGLGTQVRAHVERRFSMPFDRPAAGIGTLDRLTREPTDRPGDGQSRLAASLWPGACPESKQFWLCRRPADSSATAGLAGDGTGRRRLASQGSSQNNPHVGGVSGQFRR